MTTELRADCSRCTGLCCVALPFARSADFAIDKPAGAPCPHLEADYRCGIHDRLRPSGFAGCAAFDCFGAGQRVLQDVFPGRDWRADREDATAMFEVFTLLRQLHELLWYLDDALARDAARPLHDDLRHARAATEQLAAQVLDPPDVATHRAEVVAPLLRWASRLVRGPDAQDRSHADLAGADLRHAQLQDVDLRAATLIGADLRGLTLHHIDLLGADLRAADVRGTDLTDALYVTQAQVNGARGDAATRLPRRVVRPVHWH